MDKININELINNKATSNKEVAKLKELCLVCKEYYEQIVRNKYELTEDSAYLYDPESSKMYNYYLEEIKKCHFLYENIIEELKKYINTFKSYKLKFEIISNEHKRYLDGLPESNFATRATEKLREDLKNKIHKYEEYEKECKEIIDELAQIITTEPNLPEEDDVILEIGARTKRR